MKSRVIKELKVIALRSAETRLRRKLSYKHNWPFRTQGLHFQLIFYFKKQLQNVITFNFPSVTRVTRKVLKKCGSGSFPSALLRLFFLLNVGY